MTPKCVGALLCRNEAAPDRYLRRVLANAAQFCDELVVLDDGSTDDTAQVCRDAGANVYERGGDGEGWWGARAKPGGNDSNVNTLAPPGESIARAALWKHAATAAGEHGWVLTFDADMALSGIEPANFRRLLAAENVNSWAWVLYDLWDAETTHRVDTFWVGWQTPRIWLARAKPTPSFVPAWNGRDIHCGHLPANYPAQPGLAPPGTAWLHYSYLQKKHRLDKKRRYCEIK